MTGRRSVIAALFAVLATALPSARAQSACLDATRDEGRIAALSDARTVRLDDGRMLRLAGLELLPGSALPAFPAGTKLRWRAFGDSDRYGRIVALAAIAEAHGAIPGGTARTLQEEILAQGAAAIGAELPDAACLAPFRAAEAAARAEKRGVWNAPSATKNAESVGDHAALVGQFGIFEGKVLSVREAGTTLYVNFGSRAVRALTVIVAQPRKRAVEAGGLALMSLQGRKVRVRGFVEERGGLRIEASRPEQIEIVE
jgi:hypothetical protein